MATTVQDFVSKLKVSGNTAPRSIQHTFETALNPVLPAGGILDAIELTQLKFADSRLSGHAQWLLLVNGYLLHLTGAVSDGDKRTMSVTTQLYPLASLTEVKVRTEHEHMNEQMFLQSVYLDLAFTKGPVPQIKAALPDDKDRVERILAFAKEVLAAVATPLG